MGLPTRCIIPEVLGLRAGTASRHFSSSYLGWMVARSKDVLVVWAGFDPLAGSWESKVLDQLQPTSVVLIFPQRALLALRQPLWESLATGDIVDLSGYQGPDGKHAEAVCT